MGGLCELRPPFNSLLQSKKEQQKPDLCPSAFYSVCENYITPTKIMNGSCTIVCMQREKKAAFNRRKMGRKKKGEGDIGG